ncbi:NfeD family protein [Halosegnis marinus]|uniref:NfeD family protein n=1 Tax=Halosegnis marinus TaxID=3034023 RepID=A0ABD5ZQ29_9EURY|nr:NfeD family protein [Halosegnis sp. DT85]
MVEILGLPLSLVLLLVGTGLMVAEALAPGAHFIVVGSALTVAGLVGLLVSPFLGPLTPFVLALVVLVAGGATLGAYRKLGVGQGGASSKTSDSDSLRGQVGRVTERVTASGGEVKLDDGGFNPYYRARSMDGEIAEGSEVIVLDPGGGNVLTVAAADASEDEIDRELRRAREQRAREEEEERERDGESEAA